MRALQVHAGRVCGMLVFAGRAVWRRGVGYGLPGQRSGAGSEQLSSKVRERTPGKYGARRVIQQKDMRQELHAQGSGCG